MKQKSVQDTGFESMLILYGLSIPQWIRTNTAVQNMVNGNYVLATDQYKSRDIPAKLGDYDWYPQYSAFFEDASGSKVKLWPDNVAVFIPMPTPEWQEMLEGTTRIPTSLGGVVPDAVTAMTNFTQDVPGVFSYATMDRHGVVEQVAGNTWLPTIKNPQAVYVATVG
jgi:hypothetical protein